MNLAAHKIVAYEAVNLINGKRYIGITRRGLETRKRRHIQTSNSGRGSVIGAALRKYGTNNFSFKTLVVCPDWQYAKDVEIAAIKTFKPEYNVTAGGDGAVGFRHSEEHKTRVSERQRGNKYWLGKKHAPEAKEKMRQSRLAGVGGPVKGKKLTLSAEERERRRIRISGNKYFLGRKHSPESIQLMRVVMAHNPARANPIVCLATGIIYPSVNDAVQKLRTCSKTIRKNIGILYKYLDKP